MREDLRVGRAGDDRVWTENWSDASTSGIDEWRVAAVCTSAGQPRAATGDTHPIPFSLQVMREVCKRQRQTRWVWDGVARTFAVGTGALWRDLVTLVLLRFTSARGHFCTWALLHVGTSARGHFCTWALLHVGTSARGHFGTWQALWHWGHFCTWAFLHVVSWARQFGTGALRLGGTSARGHIGTGAHRHGDTSARGHVCTSAGFTTGCIGERAGGARYFGGRMANGGCNINGWLLEQQRSKQVGVSWFVAASSFLDAFGVVWYYAVAGVAERFKQQQKGIFLQPLVQVWAFWLFWHFFLVEEQGVPSNGSQQVFSTCYRSVWAFWCFLHFFKVLCGAVWWIRSRVFRATAVSGSSQPVTGYFKQRQQAGLLNRLAVTAGVLALSTFRSGAVRCCVVGQCGEQAVAEWAAEVRQSEVGQGWERGEQGWPGTLWEGEQGEWEGEQGEWEGEQGEWEGEQGEWEGEQGEWEGEQGEWEGEQGEWEGERGEQGRGGVEGEWESGGERMRSATCYNLVFPGGNEE
ncbi:unnamed protein product [Closterium sp. NIES-53]